MPAWGAEYHHSLMPDSRLVITEHGHFLPMKEPLGQATETAAYLEPFFARHDAPGVPPLAGVVDFAPVTQTGVTDFGAFEISGKMHWALVILLIILATFISEDATVIAVGLAIAHGRIDPFVGLVGCFLGILLGDGGLWLLGRLVGRRAMRWPVIRAWVPEASLDRWGRWFDRHSIAAVFLARAVPGTRVPTYFAAGLLSKRAHGFLLWAALAILIWTPLLLAFVIVLGPKVLDAIGSVVSGPLAVVVSIVLLLILYRVVTYAFTWTGRRRLLADILVIGKPEFWPSWVFYIPLVPWMAYLALRHRGAMTFTCANPGIAHGGGVVGESKIEILRKLEGAKNSLVGTAFIAASRAADERADEVERLANEHPGLGGYPLILKPNEAQRGHGFKVVRNREEAKRYFDTMTRDALLQEYHPGPLEIGVLWKREPSDRQGRVFSVTRKVFPVITGDGKRSLERLIWSHPRYRMQADLFLKRYDSERDRVLAKGETMRLAIAGNHCQGTMFLDGADLITPEFERAVNEIASAFEDGGLDFGRFDLRYASDEDLKAGRGFKIIELNGTMSESTNLYDPQKPVWWAYGVLLRQWATLYRIGAARRAAGVRPMSIRELVKATRDHYRGRPGSSVAD
jgi:membrane protein DedA with SNARE-associated domain